jgi:hypothetical protein
MTSDDRSVSRRVLPRGGRQDRGKTGLSPSGILVWVELSCQSCPRHSRQRPQRSVRAGGGRWCDSTGAPPSLPSHGQDRQDSMRQPHGHERLALSHPVSRLGARGVTAARQPRPARVGGHGFCGAAARTPTRHRRAGSTRRDDASRARALRGRRPGPNPRGRRKALIAARPIEMTRCGEGAGPYGPPLQAERPRNRR